MLFCKHGLCNLVVVGINRLVADHICRLPIHIHLQPLLAMGAHQASVATKLHSQDGD